MIFSEKIGLSTQTILFEILSFFPQPFAQEIDIYIVNIVFGLLDSQCCGQTGGAAAGEERCAAREGEKQRIFIHVFHRLLFFG